MKKTMIAIVFICSLASGLRAADWQNWSNFATVTAMFQTGSKLWVGGRGGVVVIDTATGQKTFYKKTAGQLPSLMVEDMAYSVAMGTTWIGTYDNGLVSVHNGQFTTYPFPDSTIRLYHIAVDAAGSVWCATNDGLYKHSNGVFTKITAVGNAWDVKAFPNGKILIGAALPNIYDPAANSVYIPLTAIVAYTSSHVEVIDDTSFYFATDHGGIIYVHDTTVVNISDTAVADNFDPEIKQLRHLADGSMLALRSDNKVFLFNGSVWAPYAYSTEAESAQATCLYQKNSGEVLAGGIAQGGQIRSIGGTNTLSIQKAAIWSDIITAVTEKSDHELWIMGGNQIGLYDINAAAFERVDTLPGASWTYKAGIFPWNGSFVAYGYNTLYQWTGSGWTPLVIPGVINQNIQGIVTDTSGGLYVASDYGFFVIHGSTAVHYYSANTGVFNSNDVVRDIHFDAVRNTIWMATSAGIVSYHAGTFSIINSSNTPQISYYNYISSIAQDDAGDMWFGSAYGGMIHYDGTTYSVEVLQDSFGNQTVNGIAFDGSAMYVVDNIYGFWVKENGTWTNYNTKNSDLTCDYLTHVYVDRNHNVWLTALDYGVQNSFGIDIFNKTSVALSVKDIHAASAMSVYPNPASAVLTISDASLRDGDIVTLTDIIGQSSVYTLSAHKINITTLSSGIYILDTHTGAAPVKVIKE